MKSPSVTIHVRAVKHYFCGVQFVMLRMEVPIFKSVDKNLQCNRSSET